MSGIELVKLDPGLQSLASATVTPASISRRASGYGCRVENSTPGSRVATVSRCRRARPRRVVEERAVVDGCRAQRDGEPHAVAGAELVAVHARQQPARDARPRARARLSARERAALAEDVDPARVRRARVEHLAADEVDVVVAAVGELRRHDVRAEEGDLGRDLGGEPGEARLVARP